MIDLLQGSVAQAEFSLSADETAEAKDSKNKRRNCFEGVICFGKGLHNGTQVTEWEHKKLECSNL